MAAADEAGSDSGGDGAGPGQAALQETTQDLQMSFAKMMQTRSPQSWSALPSELAGIIDEKHGSFSRTLLQDKPEITKEMIRGYMSNSELETAIQDFGWRCANVSRIYRTRASRRWRSRSPRTRPSARCPVNLLYDQSKHVLSKVQT
ncbi:uncharacterized protein [Triticum aestivum]|uniref:uncharacterized protein n=1 Tax=Triticum aestivum TaxID=4565 RepID=UPI001D00D709|nr:uncharacterized protein LOC123085531 [Triticum aestivum]